MKLRLLLLGALALSGCKPVVYQIPETGQTVAEAQLTDKQKFSLLDAEAKKRHLRYVIFCIKGENDYLKDGDFQADAKHAEQPEMAIYIEEGAMPYWAERGLTQADAAYRLYLSLSGGEIIFPAHAPEKMKEGANCPQDIRGGYKEKLPVPMGGVYSLHAWVSDPFLPKAGECYKMDTATTMIRIECPLK